MLICYLLLINLCKLLFVADVEVAAAVVVVVFHVYNVTTLTKADSPEDHLSETVRYVTYTLPILI